MPPPNIGTRIPSATTSTIVLGPGGASQTATIQLKNFDGDNINGARQVFAHFASGADGTMIVAGLSSVLDEGTSGQNWDVLQPGRAYLVPILSTVAGRIVLTFTNNGVPFSGRLVVALPDGLVVSAPFAIAP